MLGDLIAVDWGELALDIVLPKTDRVVAVQWAIMGPVWLFVLALSWQCERDIRHFLWGVCMINFAWFLARMVH
ncbi:MAG: hypothetical protein ACKVK3_15030 [Acidimicrobiales bacterium]